MNKALKNSVKILSLLVIFLCLTTVRAGAYTTSNATDAIVDRSFDQEVVEPGNNVTVTVTFSNPTAGAEDLRGFFYTEFIPDGLTLATVSVTLGGATVSNYLAESGSSGDVYAGTIPFRWILELPPDFTEANPISNSENLVITYTLSSAASGSFDLNEFSWAGYYASAAEAAFGHSETSDAQTLTFNYAPTITDIADQTTDEDTPIGPIAFTVADVETDAAGLTVTATSDNQSLVPDADIAIGGSAENRTISVTPAANASGTAIITVTVSDGTLTAQDSFTLTVTAVNDPPTISDIEDQTVDEDNSTATLGFNAADIETAPGALTITGTSSNTNIVPNENISFYYSGSGTFRTVTVTPAENAGGTVGITVTVSDGTLTAQESFTLTVNAINDPPTISDIADQTVDEDTAVGPIAFTVGDVDDDPADLTVTATSSNTDVIPETGISLSGTGADHTIAVTPAENASGTAIITVTVSDGTESTSDTFAVNVETVDDAPTVLNPIEDVTVYEDSDPVIIDLSTVFIDVDDDDTAITKAVFSNSNETLVSAGILDDTLTLDFSSEEHSGVATIVIRATSGGQTVDDTFMVTVKKRVSTLNIDQMIRDFKTGSATEEEVKQLIQDYMTTPAP